MINDHFNSSFFSHVTHCDHLTKRTEHRSVSQCMWTHISIVSTFRWYWVCVVDVFSVWNLWGYWMNGTWANQLKPLDGRCLAMESNEWFYSRKISFSMHEKPTHFFRVCFNRSIFRFILSYLRCWCVFFFAPLVFIKKKLKWKKWRVKFDQGNVGFGLFLLSLLLRNVPRFVWLEVV